MLKECFVEMLGSLTLSLMSSLMRLQAPEDYFILALVYFFTIGAFSAASKHVSGALFNPVLTFSLIITH